MAAEGRDVLLYPRPGTIWPFRARHDLALKLGAIEMRARIFLTVLGVMGLVGVLAFSQAATIQAAPVSIVVPATSGPSTSAGSTGFVNSGIVLAVGDVAVVTTADGVPCASRNSFSCLGPNGFGSGTCGVCPATLLPASSWIARVGTGPWVAVGSGPTTLSGTGEIQFAFNDGLYSDNSGSFVATVTLISPPVNADACKNGGWRARTDSRGNSFKNQGDCVSFVATGGRNLGAGN